MLDRVNPSDLVGKTTLHSIGKVTIQKGSHEVIGYFTKWNDNVFPGCYFYIPGDKYAYRISAIIDASNLNLAVPYEGDNRYECAYVIFRPPKKWFQCSCDKKEVVVDGVDKVKFNGTVVGSTLRITKGSDYMYEEVMSSSVYEFMPSITGYHNFTFTMPGYYPRQIVIKAV